MAKKLTGTYSGGMKRRLDLASALMHRPPLLILDEPTEGLDPQSRTALWEELERIGAEGTTMLLTTHYMEEADRLCSRLAIVDTGKIVVDGPSGRTQGDRRRRFGRSAARVEQRRRQGRHRVCRLLEDMIPCRGGRARIPAGVTLAVPNANAGDPQLMRRLDGNGLRISGLQMSQPSLDDVFLKYTGRHIREEAADQPIIMAW